MFTLKGKQDGFRLLLPDEFIVNEINDKYTRIIKEKKGYLYRPIDFLNETIQGIQVLGFQDGVIEQIQPSHNGKPMIDADRIKQNNFMHTGSEYVYRSEKNPLALIDKTLNITFRHTLGFLNYFLIFENFWYQYSRDFQFKYPRNPKNSNLVEQFAIDLFDNIGQIYSRIILYNPIINGIDMLDLNYTQPIAQSQTFQVTFKYSNIDYQFIYKDEEEL